MNIGYLLDCASRNAGGLFESVRRLAQSFPQESGTTLVFSLADEYAGQDTSRWQPIEVRLFNRKYLPAWGYSPELRGALLDAPLALLMTHGLWKYNSVASQAWHRRTGRPYIIHPHGMLDPWAVDNSKWKKRAAAFLYEDDHLHGAACIRALCDSEAQSIRAYGLRNPICVIPNGIDLPEPRAISNDEFRMTNADGRKVLLYLGRLHPKKNLGPLIEAWAEVQRDSKAARDWVLAIAGWDQGGYEAELHRQCEQLGLKFVDGSQKLGSNVGLSPVSELQSPATASVVFLGPKFGDDKAACYANCDAFILPSLSEGLPMVVLEAWAYAKPVLMTNECNLPEGFKANAALQIGTSADSIAAGLRKLFEMNDSERVVMGGRGRTLAGEKFSWKEIGAEMRRVCEWTVNGGAAPASVRFD